MPSGKPSIIIRKQADMPEMWYHVVDMAEEPGRSSITTPGCCKRKEWCSRQLRRSCACLGSRGFACRTKGRCDLRLVCARWLIVSSRAAKRSTDEWLRDPEAYFPTGSRRTVGSDVVHTPTCNSVKEKALGARLILSLGPVYRRHPRNCFRQGPS